MSAHETAVKKFIEYFNVDFRLKNLELLNEIVQKFSRIPYENITKIINSYEIPDQDARLRYPEEIIEEHIKLAAGGTCFSLVYYLSRILEELEFSCKTCMADMNYGANIHCAIVVSMNGEEFLVDPGYLLTEPMKLSVNSSVVHETATNSVQIVPENSDYNVYTI